MTKGRTWALEGVFSPLWERQSAEHQAGASLGDPWRQPPGQELLPGDSLSVSRVCLHSGQHLRVLERGFSHLADGD